MKICPSCGEENSERARFCQACASPLDEPEPLREERKVVTVLFCDLVGFTARSDRMDPEDVQALLAGYHEHLRGELERFGGTVEKFIGDAVVGVFGTPAAHEDDPERAVRAALSIRDWARERDGLELRIAVNTGDALVTLGARADRGEAFVAGDCVNVAARLQSAAPANGILVGEQTHRATRNAIDYRGAAEVVAKGKVEPLRVWEALEARSRLGVDVRQNGRAPLVGREGELDELCDKLARVRRQREPQLVTLVGVPGIGKSRLVFELFQHADADPEFIRWRQGRSLAYGEGVAFWALGEMVKAEAGVLETDPPDDVTAKLRHAVREVLEEDADWVERRLRPLLGLVSDGPKADDGRSESFAAWRRYVEALAERDPLVLVFEDLHWADDGLLDFVDYLVERTSGLPLLVLATARPELLARRPAWSGGKANATTLSLSPLSERDTARLLHALFERAVLPADVQTSLLERAGGNPLYAEEFVRLVVEGESVSVPDSIHGIIAARLDALTPVEKQVLHDAAVVGRAFWLGALGGERWQLEEVLHGLERKEFVRRERQSSVAGETEYLFRHALVRDVAYEQIPRADRVAKHRRAAEWSASLGRPEDHAEMLAYHYVCALEFARRAGQDTADLAERARLALRDAGDRASALNAVTAAARFYSDALALWPSDAPGRPRLLLGRARALQIAGAPEAEEALDEARTALAAAGDRDGGAEAECFLADLRWFRGDAERSSGHVERAYELLRGGDASAAKARVLSEVSRFRMLAGQSAEAIDVGREALALADELGLDELRARTLTTIGTARWALGDAGGAGDVERAVEIALAASSHEASRAYFNLASLAVDGGDLERAVAFYRESASVAERFGHKLFKIQSLAAVAPYLYIRGQWDESMQAADGFIADAEASGGHYLEGQFRSGRALMRLARGDERGALDDAGLAVDLARKATDPQAVFPAAGRALRVYVELGRPREAAALADEFLALARGSRSGSHLPDFAWTARALGREAEVRELLARGPGESPWARAAQAIVDRDYVGAAEIFAAAGAVADDADARLRAAEDLVADGRRAEADVQLRHALGFYRSVGATRFVRRAEALLAETA